MCPSEANGGTWSAVITVISKARHVISLRQCYTCDYVCWQQPVDVNYHLYTLRCSSYSAAKTQCCQHFLSVHYRRCHDEFLIRKSLFDFTNLKVGTFLLGIFSDSVFLFCSRSTVMDLWRLPSHSRIMSTSGNAGHFQLLSCWETWTTAMTIYFRQDSSPEVLWQVEEHMEQAFPGSTEAKPVDTFLITWDNIAAAESSGRGNELDTDLKISSPSALFWNYANYFQLLESLTLSASPSEEHLPDGGGIHKWLLLRHPHVTSAWTAVPLHNARRRPWDWLQWRSGWESVLVHKAWAVLPFQHQWRLVHQEPSSVRMWWCHSCKTSKKQHFVYDSGDVLTQLPSSGNKKAVTVTGLNHWARNGWLCSCVFGFHLWRRSSGTTTYIPM